MFFDIDSFFKKEEEPEKKKTRKKKFHIEQEEELSEREENDQSDPVERKSQYDIREAGHSENIYDIYDIDMKLYTKDAVRNRKIDEIISYKAYVYPLSLPDETGNSFAAEIAGYVKNENEGTCNCGATTVFGKKTLVITLGKHGIILKGRWMKGEFISSAFIMNTSGENLDVTMDMVPVRTEKYGLLGHEVKNIEGRELHIMPLKEEGMIMAAEIYDNENTIVACGEEGVYIDDVFIPNNQE